MPTLPLQGQEICWAAHPAHLLLFCTKTQELGIPAAWVQLSACPQSLSVSMLQLDILVACHTGIIDTLFMSFQCPCLQPKLLETLSPAFLAVIQPGITMWSYSIRLEYRREGGIAQQKPLPFMPWKAAGSNPILSFRPWNGTQHAFSLLNISKRLRGVSCLVTHLVL